MITNSKYVTVAHVSSESGDHYLMTLEGDLTNQEIKEAMDWEDPECLWIEQTELIEFQVESFEVIE